MRVKIAVLTVSFCVLFNSLWASTHDSQDLMNIDPYSVESVEKYFPEAVQTITVVEKPEAYSYLKTTSGPHLKLVKKIDYEKLIPYMISHMQEQNKMRNK